MRGDNSEWENGEHFLNRLSFEISRDNGVCVMDDSYHFSFCGDAYDLTEFSLPHGLPGDHPFHGWDFFRAIHVNSGILARLFRGVDGVMDKNKLVVNFYTSERVPA